MVVADRFVLRGGEVPMKAHPQINWDMISGLALSLAISAGFWVAVGKLVARILK